MLSQSIIALWGGMGKEEEVVFGVCAQGPDLRCSPSPSGWASSVLSACSRVHDPRAEDIPAWLSQGVTHPAPCIVVVGTKAAQLEVPEGTPWAMLCTWAL